MGTDPQLAAWRLARAGKWDRFERLLRRSPVARSFIRMLPYQMYFDGYQRAEHIARVIDAQEEAACQDSEERENGPQTQELAPGNASTDGVDLPESDSSRRLGSMPKPDRQEKPDSFRFGGQGKKQSQ